MNEENNQSGSLLSGQDPHQKEDMDQATRASAASFNLEPEKGISPDPDENINVKEKTNIKEGRPKGDENFTGDISSNIEELDDTPDLSEGEFDVTPEDLKNLNAQDNDQDKGEQDEIIGLS
ncbi:hypothetical protein [Pedobacter nyackensis]|uniref:Uncharacterized protein n=1 Tax=Pedobacter nyackensis TaxID=475255 RepID=A0A1W2EL36_9SPHI|nr:hypothetical protein [Pedobacter nyackensis]SMD10430.1 hypothetical protein SAMN04488101_11398 [Pedobacter nyackensis]